MNTRIKFLFFSLSSSLFFSYFPGSPDYAGFCKGTHGHSR